jgi:hypothetical protein
MTIRLPFFIVIGPLVLPTSSIVGATRTIRNEAPFAPASIFDRHDP